MIKNISIKDFIVIDNLISSDEKNFNFFFNLGWTIQQIKIQLSKKNNFSIGSFENNKLIGFLLGDKISVNETADLDLHILYINSRNRRNRIGSNLLNYIEQNKEINKISKIYLEVAENNIPAIKFYEKNSFVFSNFRHNYYKYSEINAKCYFKEIK